MIEVYYEIDSVKHRLRKMKRYKKQRNKCVSIRKKSIKNYFKKIANETIVTNKNFWRIISPFLTNKRHLENAEFILIQDKKTISNENLNL